VTSTDAGANFKTIRMLFLGQATTAVATSHSLIPLWRSEPSANGNLREDSLRRCPSTRGAAHLVASRSLVQCSFSAKSWNSQFSDLPQLRRLMRRCGEICAPPDHSANCKMPGRIPEQRSLTSTSSDIHGSERVCRGRCGGSCPRNRGLPDCIAPDSLRGWPRHLHSVRCNCRKVS
jgi:hypothetical protein